MCVSLNSQCALTKKKKLYPADRNHRMPIITPAYPSMCATHNVTESTRKIMIQEFKNGTEVVSKIMMGTGQWSDLFAKSDFFQQFKHYLQITSASHSTETQLTWSGLVESKLRQLILKLEMVDLIELAHPYVKGYDKVHYCLTDEEVEEAMKGVLLEGRSISVEEGSLETDHTDQLKESGHLTDENQVQKVYTTTFFIGLNITKVKTGKWIKKEIRFFFFFLKKKRHSRHRQKIEPSFAHARFPKVSQDVG